MLNNGKCLWNPNNSLYQQCISTVYINSVCEQFISTVCMSSLYQHCLSTVYINSVYEQFISTVCMSSLYQQCVSAVYINSVYQQFISTVCISSLYQQFVSTGSRKHKEQLSFYRKLDCSSRYEDIYFTV
jgi:hypothetical protein